MLGLARRPSPNPPPPARHPEPSTEKLTSSVPSFTRAGSPTRRFWHVGARRRRIGSAGLQAYPCPTPSRSTRITNDLRSIIPTIPTGFAQLGEANRHQLVASSLTCQRAVQTPPFPPWEEISQFAIFSPFCQ